MSLPRRAAILTAGITMLGMSFAPSVSAEPTDPFSVTFPAGQACEFELRVDGGAGNRHPKEFVDEAGNTIRIIDAGLGHALTFTNTVNDEQLSFKANGAVTQTTINPDGSNRIVLTGHFVVVLFPADTPPGPTTTLYVGRVVLTNTPSFISTIESESGRQTDICAALS